MRDRSTPELLALHAETMTILRDRGVLRSANNPTGDLGEWLFCNAFGWQQAANSEKGYDAVDNGGTRYQIKARRLHQANTSRQLSAIRSLEGFDVLAAVLFDGNYRVLRAALVPVEVVRLNSKFYAHTNSLRFMMQDRVWDQPDVQDVTERLREIERPA